MVILLMVIILAVFIIVATRDDMSCDHEYEIEEVKKNKSVYVNMYCKKCGKHTTFKKF